MTKGTTEVTKVTEATTVAPTEATQGTEAGQPSDTKTDAAGKPGQTDAAQPDKTDAVAVSTEAVQSGSDAVNGSEQPEENATTSGATGKYLCVALLALCIQQLVF